MKKYLLSFLFVLLPQLVIAQPYSAQIQRALNNFPDSFASNPYTCDATLEKRQYYNTTDHTAYFCNATSWVAFAAGGGNAGLSANNTFTGTNRFTGVTSLPGSNTPPATCTAGTDIYIDTNATSGSRWLICESTNTWVAQGASSLVVGTTPITSGSTTRVFFDNAGVLGLYSIIGSGSVAMTTSPVFTTPDLGVAVGNGLTLTGGDLILAGLAANIRLGSNYLSGDGGDEGISVDSAGVVAFSAAASGPSLTLNGATGFLTTTSSSSASYSGSQFQNDQGANAYYNAINYGSANGASIGGISKNNLTVLETGGSASTGLAFATATADPLYFITGNSLAMTISATGTTTINNGSNAVSPLVVQDNGSAIFTIADGGAVAGTANYTITAVDPSFIASNTSTTANASIATKNSADTVYAVMTASGTAESGTFLGVNKAGLSRLVALGSAVTGLAVGTSTADPLVLGTNDTENLRIASGGAITVPSTGSFAVGTTTTAGTATTVSDAAMGGSSATDNFLNITGTLPTTLSALTTGIDVQLTSAGSSAQNIIGARFYTLAGFTGAASTYGLVGRNAAASTVAFATAAGLGGAIGTVGQCDGGTGCIGLAGTGSAGTNSVGGAFYGAGTSTLSLGVIGQANPAATTRVGGFFGLSTATPTFASAALMADNGSAANDIFVGRDNGTAVFSVTDGGPVTMTSTLTSSRTTDFGWTAVAGANTACNTTCTSACVFGTDSVTAGILLCTDATADVCLCAGSS